LPQRFFIKRSLFILLVLIFSFPGFIFAQASLLRDYVGLINQSYHPGIVSLFEKIKKEFEKQGDSDAAKVVDIIIKGGFGSGFLYSDARGNFYVITNNHVIAQAHTISITFERTDGTKKRIDNLRLIATDVENDLAIMALPQGERPLVTQGMAFINRAPEEGEEVFSAGFPGLGITPIWQFGNGRISNASARFPKSILDETLMGPFIQHTAQVDMGNSGGPLLLAQRNAPSGYAVAGINTLSAMQRQAANYAIPISTLQPFITSSLNPNPQSYRAALDEKLKKFTEGLDVNKAVYPHISDFLSTVCIGENVEYAYEEMSRKASSSVKRTFLERAKEDLVAAMGIAVAWTIENNIRSGTSIKASVKEVTGEGEEYAVVFTINNKDYNSVWIREYGNWRIKTFGSAASGDKTRVEKREKEKEVREKLRLDSSFMIGLGYAYLFEAAPAAINAGIEGTRFGLNFYSVSANLWSIGITYGHHFSVPIGNIGLMPYIKIGYAYVHRSESYFKRDDDLDQPLVFKNLFAMPITFNLGTKFLTTAVPGLFLDAGFQFNAVLFDIINDSNRINDFKMGISIRAGYAF